MDWQPLEEVAVRGGLVWLLTLLGAGASLAVFIGVDAIACTIFGRSGQRFLAHWRGRTPWDPNRQTRWSLEKTLKWAAGIALVPYLTGILGALLVVFLAPLFGPS